MKCFRAIVVLGLLAWTISPAFAQSKLVLSVDYSRFRLDSASTFLEVYYSYTNRDLQVRKTDEGYKTSLLMTAQLITVNNDSVVMQKRWRVPHVVIDSAQAVSNEALVGIINFAVPFGEYSLKVKGEDEFRPANIDSLVYPFHSLPIERKDASLSDVELCSSIKQAETKDNIFYKNTLEVVPNPTKLYGVGIPMVFYYAEAYCLDAVQTDPFFYTRISVYNSANREVIHQSKKRNRNRESSVEVGTMNIGKLPSGTYTFYFSLTDSSGNPKISAGKKFWVYNPNIADTSKYQEFPVDVLTSEYATMTEQELDQEFDYSTYTATPEEKDRYEALKGVDAKRKFMFEFWRIRDTDPSTPQNEGKDEYMKRVEYTKITYRAMSRSGYKSDRGRVYIMYGPPDDIERHPNETDYRPYEIWTYNNIQGGVIFVFVDRTGFSEYQLVHSTHRNEMRDDNWMSKAQMSQ